MKITKDYEGLKRIENGDYVLEGDLISDENIEIGLDDRLVVRGSIRSAKSIIANISMIAGLGIKAGEGIEVNNRIFAGTSVYHNSTNCDKTIKCQRLLKGEIAYGVLELTKAGARNDA